MKRSIAVLFLWLVIFVFAACGNTDSAVPEEAVEEETEPEKVEVPHYYDPLTHLEVSEPVTGRLIAVSIDNHRAARPQYGLSGASIIYEVPAEGMIPRLVALFYGTVPDQIGGVRSARPYIVDIAREWDAVLVHCGGSEYALSYLASGVVDDLDEIRNGSCFWRDYNRSAPHNLLTSGERIYETLEARGYDTVSEDVRQLTFRGRWEPVIGEKADHIEVDFNYSDNVFTYDKSIRCYYRSTDGTTFTDGSNGEPIRAANIIVQKISSYVTDGYGHLSIDLCAGGEALLFTDGKVIHGSWSRADLDSPTYFVDENGEQFHLTAGVTWIEMVDGNTTLSYYDSAADGAEESED